MRRNNREINTLSLSALDLFATAMGAFAIIMLILFRTTARRTWRSRR